MVFQRAAQLVYRSAHVVRRHAGAFRPHLKCQVAGREGIAPRRQQDFEETELARRQVEGLAVDENGSPSFLHVHAAAVDPIREHPRQRGEKRAGGRPVTYVVADGRGQEHGVLVTVHLRIGPIVTGERPDVRHVPPQGRAIDLAFLVVRELDLQALYSWRSQELRDADVGEMTDEVLPQPRTHPSSENTRDHS